MKKCSFISKFLILTGTAVSLTSCLFAPANNKATEKFLKISDPKVSDYQVGEVFDSFIDNGGMSVKVVKSDASEVSLTKESYTYTVADKNNPNWLIDSTSPFQKSGDYVVSVSRQQLETVKYNIRVNAPEKVLLNITISGQKTGFVVGDTFSFGGIVIANYNDGSSADVTSQATYSGYNLSTTGTQNVTVSFGGKSISYVIHVTSSVVLVNSVSFNVSSKSLNIGDTFTINATVSPSDATNKVLNWTTSNSTVAAVSDGVITAKAVGTATITAKSTDGSNKQATLSLTVTKPTVLVTSITLDVTSKSLYVGDKFTVNATVLPSDATNKTLTWSTSSITVASVSNGVITAKAAGSATITAKASDGSKKQATLSLTVSVKPVAVTGISLDKSTLSLKAGGSAQLTATISPSNATDKTVTWSGSANGISVNSSGSVSVLSTATVGNTATIVATANGDTSKTASCVVTVVDEPTFDDEWTLLIYMCGADLESDYSQGGAATEDLSEIYSLRSSLPSDVNVVVQAGGAKSWKSDYSSVISKDKCNRFHLTKSGYVKDSQTSKVNMGLESSLESFVEWGLTTYPAEKVGLIFWNHGGAMDGCCFDEQNSNDGLTPAEVSSAIPTAISRSNYNKNLEFIGYDCCLMSVQDIAGLNAEYANYMIASEESEYGYGWTYDEWVDDLFAKKSTETILKACVDSFISEAEYIYKYYYGESCDQTLAYYNLSNWNTYETAWENFASYLSSNVITSSSEWDTFANVINKAKKYGRYTDSQVQGFNNGYICDIFDVKDALNKIKADSNYKNNSTLMSKVSDVETAFTDLSVYSKCGSAAGNSNGICMFCPISGYNEKNVQYASNNTCFTNWRSLCRSYGNWYY